MVQSTRLPLSRRTDLVMTVPGVRGDSVIKDPRSGSYFSLGEQESFLLQNMDGKLTAEDICDAYRRRFGEPLTRDDFDEFVEMARTQGLLQSDQKTPHQPKPSVEQASKSPSDKEPVAAKKKQSVIYWRFKLFDPDPILNVLEPRLRFCWTRAFLFSAMAIIAFAMLVSLLTVREAVGFLPSVLRWETLLLGWLALVVVTTIHEFAHGLTCKHYGGEVHEIGFLLLFFMPSFYCNVSDAWLMPEKSKRIWITLAGTFMDALLWALAVLTWRISSPDTNLYYVAWVVMTICGVRMFLNVNPLLPLDGYYLLGDLMEIPNLRKTSRAYLMSHLRWLLWGGPKPERENHGKFLITYAVTSLVFSVVYLTALVFGLVVSLGAQWGWWSVALVILYFRYVVPLRFKGLLTDEFANMIRQRHMRTAVWSMAGLGVFALLWWGQMEDRATGPWRLRPMVRAEIRAPVTGFLKSVSGDEGTRLTAEDVVGWLEIPDLASRTAQKKAEIVESQAKVRLLEIGPRPEEIREQRLRVQRADEWQELARQDLLKARDAHKNEIARLDQQINRAEANVKFAKESLDVSQQLARKDAMSQVHLREAEKDYLIARAMLDEAKEKKSALDTIGTTQKEAEWARRQKEHADSQATLALLEAGTRPEELDGQRAHLARLVEEMKYLEILSGKVRLTTTVGGVIITPRLKEKIGHYFKEGDLICEIEEPAILEVEIALDEQEAAKVEVGQMVQLKARALPFETFWATVERIAPTALATDASSTMAQAERPAAQALKHDAHSTVTVYCRLALPDPHLKTGMHGHARVMCGQRSLGSILSHRVVRLFRTEFWW